MWYSKWVFLGSMRATMVGLSDCGAKQKITFETSPRSASYIKILQFYCRYYRMLILRSTFTQQHNNTNHFQIIARCRLLLFRSARSTIYLNFKRWYRCRKFEVTGQILLLKVFFRQFSWIQKGHIDDREFIRAYFVYVYGSRAYIYIYSWQRGSRGVRREDHLSVRDT